VVSIVIPIYNVENYIDECLNSVISQSYKDIEILCINDCTTDSSIERVKEYMKTDNRIVLIENEKNCGLSYTRNVGLKNAKGEFIWFVDSDDMIAENAVEKLVLFAEQRNVDVVYFNFTMKKEIDDDYHYTYCTSGDYDDVSSAPAFMNRMFINKEQRAPACIQFWRTDVLRGNSIFFEEGILHEDEIFSYESLLKANKVGFINAGLYIYRRHAGTITTEESAVRHIHGYISVLLRFFVLWQQYQCDEIDMYSNMFYENIRYTILRYYYGLGEKSKEALSPCEKKVIQILNDEKEGKSSIHLQKDDGIFAELDSRISQASNVFVYGIGLYAECLCNYLFLKKKIVPKAFVVTKTNNKENAIINSCELYDLDSFPDVMRDDLIIVAASEKVTPEIVALLDDKGVNNYFLLDNNLRSKLRLFK